MLKERFRTGLLLGLSGLLGAVLLAACENGEEGVPLDGAVEAGPDGGGFEAALDGTTETGRDGPGPSETGPDVFPWLLDAADGPQGAETGPDGPQGSEAGGDGSPGPANAKCASPQAVTLTPGTKTTITADTTGAANEFGSSISCNTGYTFDGPQLYYKLTLQGGTMYRMVVTPSASWDPAIYVFSDATCTASTIDSQCASFVADDYMDGQAETLYVSASSTGTYLVAVDSYDSSSYGPFSLTIEDLPLPANSTCAKAQVLTLSGTPKTATVSGDTTGAANEFGSNITCGTSTALSGSQVYYKVSLASGSSYRFTLTPGFNAALYLFRASSCPASGSVDTDCASKGSVGDLLSPVTSGSSKSLLLSPTISGDYIVAVDSASSIAAGSFTLVVEEYAMPTNSGCAKAQTLTLSGSPPSATVSGDTTYAANEFGSSISCGTSYNFDGPQLYYQVALSAGKAYKVQLTPSSSWDPALYAFVDPTCTAATINTLCASLVADDYSSGQVETIYIIPATGQTYTLVVDSVSSSSAGTFTLTIEETSLPTNFYCTTAQTLTLSGSPASVTANGDTTYATNEFGTSIDCLTGYTFDGPQLYYQVALTAGKTYRIKVTPASGWDPALYAFTDPTCTAATIDSQCASHAADDNGDGQEESIEITPGTSQTYTVAVDSYDSSSCGSFTLTIQEYTPPTNGTCAKAQVLTLSGSPKGATVTGDTLGVADEYSTLYCGGYYAMDGPQLYYKVSLTGGTQYMFKLSPGFDDAYAYVFRAASCGSATLVDADCGSKGTNGDVVSYIDSGETNWLLFTPAASGDYIVAVDSDSSSSAGSFTLVVREITVVTFTAPQSWDFESSCQGLAATGEWECGQIAFLAGTSCDSSGYQAPTASASGTGKGMWGTVLNDCYSPVGNNDGYSSSACSNTKPLDDSILSFKVSIPATWSTATLSYYSWEDLYSYSDWLEVRVNNVSLKATCSPPSPVGWVKKTIDLSTHVGQTVTVAFHFMSSFYDQYTGWYIDDLSISGS